MIEDLLLYAISNRGVEIFALVFMTYLNVKLLRMNQQLLRADLSVDEDTLRRVEEIERQIGLQRK